MHNLEEDNINKFLTILKKIFSNYEKEYKHSVIKVERKISISQPKEETRISRAKEALKNKPKIKLPKLSTMHKIEFLQKLKNLLQIYSNFSNILIIKTKKTHTQEMGAIQNTLNDDYLYQYSFDNQSFKNDISYKQIKEDRKFPWQLLNSSKLPTSLHNKEMFLKLIQTEDSYAKRFLDKKRKRLKKLGESSKIKHIICENSAEGKVVRDYEEDNNLYCYCQQKFREGDFMISRIIFNISVPKRGNMHRFNRRVVPYRLSKGGNKRQIHRGDKGSRFCFHMQIMFIE